MAGAPAAAARRRRGTLLLLGLALALWALYASLFTVDVTEHGVVTRFGRVVRVVDEPGLHAKAPFDRVARLDRRLLYLRPPQAEYLTADKKNVVVRSLATWRIADARRFLETLGTRADAEARLGDVVLAEIGAALGGHPFAAFIAADGRDSRFRAMVARVRGDVAAFARSAYGVEVVDVSVRQLALPEQNRQSVFERMKAERGKMAKEFRSEGERESKKMIAAADRERTRILAEAYERAQRVRAEGEAEAMRTYAAAFSENPSFYRFLRTLQAYDRILDDSTTLFLPADAEIFRLLQDDGDDGAAPPGGREGPPPAGAPPPGEPPPDELASPGDDGRLIPAPVEAGATAAPWRRAPPPRLKRGLPR